MALEVLWTKDAEAQLDGIIKYLEANNFLLARESN